MDVATTAPKFSAPFTKIVTVDVNWRDTGKLDFLDAHIDPTADIPFWNGGTDLGRAVADGVSLARSSKQDQCLALLQATDGNYYLSELNTIRWENRDGKVVHGTEVPLSIDGRSVSTAHATRKHPDLIGIVGAYSWIDLRGKNDAGRTRLPSKTS